MLRKVTPENAIAFVRRSLLLSFCWPLPSVATKRQIVRFRMFSFLSFVNMSFLYMPLLSIFQNCGSHPDICIKSLPITVGGTQMILLMSLCHGQYKRLQLLIAEMENYCKLAKGHEMEILQQSVDRCATFYAAVVAWYYLTAIVVICSPPLLKEPFPTYAMYPFDVEYQPLRTIIYAQQSYAGLQMASYLCVNTFVALLLWFASIRFDILSNELRMVSNIYELIQCIRKHQEILRYAKEITHAVRFLVLTTVGCTSLALLFCGVTFVSRQPLIIKLQFLLLLLTCLFQVFTFCWPANNLLLVSTDVGQAIYESLWYHRNTNLQKNLPFFLLRCQKPVIVTVACFIPILSLQYFGSFLSSAFSYFTTLRMMIENKDTNEA